MVGDSDSVRIASQIMQHMFGAAERRLGIDNPVLAVKCAQEDGEALLVVKWHALTEEAQLIAGQEAPQSGNELAAEDTATSSICGLMSGAGKWPRAMSSSFATPTIL